MISRSFEEVLHRSVALETFGSPQRSPIPWSFDDPESVLYGFSMDGEREHSQLHQGKP